MSDKIRLVVGLGNPGAEYDRTRHNAGFEFIDELARSQGVTMTPDRKYFGEVARCDGFYLLKPMTFMNRSGQAVQALASFYKIDLADILVAHDELDLPPGTAKLKVGGGHGGHNGLRDIIARHSNRKDFKRLRLGIGHPGSADQVVNYVLGRPPVSEQQLISDAVAEAVANFDTISSHWHKAMTHMNQYKAGK